MKVSRKQSQAGGADTERQAKAEVVRFSLLLILLTLLPVTLLFLTPAVGFLSGRWSFWLVLVLCCWLIWALIAMGSKNREPAPRSGSGLRASHVALLTILGVGASPAFATDHFNLGGGFIRWSLHTAVHPLLQKDIVLLG